MKFQGGACSAAACVVMLASCFGIAHAQQPVVPVAATASSSQVAGAPENLDGFRLLAISASEGVAVLRAPNGKLLTLTQGTVVPGTRARLTQVMADRLQFEIMVDKGSREGAWMFRVATPEEPSVIQRWSGQAPPMAAVSRRGTSFLPPAK